MPKEPKPGWLYVEADNPIKKEYAIHLATGWVYFVDGVKYSPEEIKLIAASGEFASLAVHNIKKVFGGEIVKYESESESGSGTTDKGKQNESGGPKGTDNPPTIGGKVPANSGYSAGDESGELDIF
ncbi:hypothetical protein FACS189447_07660 [Spirochaetia bacterium]|nr:hypothetical protein FACS189447_07660 [Spirochaetia bacterium]